jgi:hypothetical protein
MAFKDEPDYPNIEFSHPWKATITSLSDKYSSIGLYLDYNDTEIACPSCNVKVPVFSKKTYMLGLPDIFFGVRTFLTANVPVIIRHNAMCKFDQIPAATCNTLLLDVIIHLIEDKGLNRHNPLNYLFKALEIA